MAAFVLDTFALVAFFRAEKGADDVEKLLVDALTGSHQLYLCSYKCRRNILLHLEKRRQKQWRMPAAENYYNFKLLL